MTSIVCILLGFVVGEALRGYNAPSLSTLAWKDYDAGTNPRQDWTLIIQFVIILFPGINMITTAPPFAIALSENLFAYTKSEN
mmetsp:Transcript_17197/g.2840  ORF Transcript_17197/g.2840 Transcript_17197/m.2840 type:complete len:83 (+) Transcript_17197:867-1115(+)